MRKKLTVILPLYLASFILLAFSVFPHHHHNSFICFNPIHKFSAEYPRHHSHPELPEKGCRIQYLFQADNIKTFSRYTAQSEDTPAPDAFFCYTLPECLSLSCPAHSPGVLPDAADDRFRQFLFSSHKFTRGPPRIG